MTFGLAQGEDAGNGSLTYSSNVIQRIVHIEDDGSDLRATSGGGAIWLVAGGCHCLPGGR